jgi:hypothetical protein
LCFNKTIVIEIIIVNCECNFGEKKSNFLF